MSATFETGPDAPFIASLFIPHGRSRRVLAVGRIRGGSVLVQQRPRFGDVAATGTREAAARTRGRKQAELEAVRQAGFRAWDHREQRGEES
jgi:hypothetical protein